VVRSRVTRWVFVLVALALAIAAIARYGEQIRAAAVDLHPLSVVCAAGLVLIATGFMMLSWRRVLEDLGSPLPLGAAVRVFSLSQLGKYIPGSIWPFVAQVELGREHGVPRTRSAAVSVIAVVISVVTSVVVASVALPLAAQDAAHAYWWVLVATPVLVAMLHPRVLNPGLDWALKIARRPPMEHRLTLRGITVSAAWNLAGWTAYGLQIWVLAVDLGGTGWALPLASTGAFALAWSAGFLFVIAPAGAGIRELVLAASLGSALGVGQVVLLVIASRLIVTIGDLVWAGAGYLLGRRHAALQPNELEEALALRRDTTPG